MTRRYVSGQFSRRDLLLLGGVCFGVGLLERFIRDQPWWVMSLIVAMAGSLLGLLSERREPVTARRILGVLAIALVAGVVWKLL